MAAYPPADATREQVKAWEDAQDPAKGRDTCVCGHMRCEHVPGGACEASSSLELLLSKGCGCSGFRYVTKAEIVRILGGKP